MIELQKSKMQLKLETDCDNVVEITVCGLLWRSYCTMRHAAPYRKFSPFHWFLFIMHQHHNTKTGTISPCGQLEKSNCILFLLPSLEKHDNLMLFNVYREKEWDNTMHLCDFRHQTTYFKCYQLIKSQLLTVISSINSNCKCLFLLTRTAQGAYYLTLIIEASSTLSHW